MRKAISIAAVTTFLSMFAASAFGICVGEKDSTYQLLRHYDGTIGDSYRVRLTITITGNEIEGVYFYATQLKDILIRGKVVDGSKFVMDELDSQGDTTGHFEGEFPEQDPRGKSGASKLQCGAMEQGLKQEGYELAASQDNF